LRLLARAGLTDRIAADYPPEIADLLRRRTWSGALEDLIRGPAGRQRPLFVKVGVAQRVQADAFASQLVASLDVVLAVSKTGPRTRVLCSEPVDWIAEWRVFVCEGRILDAALYAPALERVDQARPEMLIDFAVAEDAVQRLGGSPSGIAGYALDLGVLRGGETALIELNDGLALAGYGLPAPAYIDLHRARWRELMRSSSSPRR
jgi:hypothetical protein